MAELRVGDPGLIATDVGPVIDGAARAMLEEHEARLRQVGLPLAKARLGSDCTQGTFFAPSAFVIDRLEDLERVVFEREIFGPILHVAKWAPDGLDAILDVIDGAGYGLTLGIHSRIEDFVHRVHGRLRIGNAYINRNMIGAVVGVQPFGGERLSGTGPKAGGPWSLHRFAVERTLTVNLAAAGGNAQLLSLGDDEA
jgi:RHH-type proline utilization regulon transcriptional repressor/proline dehydrogenase/delta 1-pyrroline-5-carboxylate dehydrogenase